MREGVDSKAPGENWGDETILYYDHSGNHMLFPKLEELYSKRVSLTVCKLYLS